MLKAESSLVDSLDVTFPEVTGATINPGTGVRKVALGESFRFIIILEDGYTESQVVAYANGVQLEQNPPDDTLVPPVEGDLIPYAFYYKLENVIEDVEIRIEGIEENNPMNTVLVEDEIQLSAIRGALVVKTTRPTPVSVYTLTGRLKTQETVMGFATIPLTRSIYIVKAGDMARKIVIKD